MWRRTMRGSVYFEHFSDEMAPPLAVHVSQVYEETQKHDKQIEFECKGEADGLAQSRR